MTWKNGIKVIRITKDNDTSWHNSIGYKEHLN